ncbi:MAG TPA: START domain-containing protein [Bacteroidia bacterium]|nr:START domain-containing protein [Bacteroidia bacterium]
MKLNSNIFIFLFCCISSSLKAQDQYKWELKKESDGIFVYTADVKGSEYKVFKAITTISSSGMHEIAASILDASNCKLIYPDTRECYQIKKYSDGNFLQYQLSDIQWPAEDRDGVYEIKSQYQKDGNELTVFINCIQYDLPKRKHVVRMTEGSGFWKIRETRKGYYEVIYQYHANPAGSIPIWLVNIFLETNPLKTMQNLKSSITRGDFKNVKLDFIN